MNKQLEYLPTAMNTTTLIIIFSLFALPLLISLEKAGAATKTATDDGVYIVYMGAKSPQNGASSSTHHYNHLLTSVSKLRKGALVRTYKHRISGFAARLTADEARSIAKQPGVVSVIPDTYYQLHTTRSWDFLKYETGVEIYSNPGPSQTTSPPGSDVVIGIIDTGIWPESKSFGGDSMNQKLSGWNGTCMTTSDFNSTSCNGKIVGARFYHDPQARDFVGHGTHVASTAAGVEVQNASFYGLAAGTAKGGSPGSRIAVYRVCTPSGCRSSSILAAFDDAIADGVNVLSVSLGASSFSMPDFKEDTISIGAFHAVLSGITVVCSAGNDGPDPSTVVNGAPWILTVAATTIDRDFESDVVLGGGKIVKMQGVFTLISLVVSYTQVAKCMILVMIGFNMCCRSCIPGTIDKAKVNGTIVLCDNKDQGYSISEKEEAVSSQGGVGVILVNDLTRRVASTFRSFPAVVVSSTKAAEIISYINSTKNPVATILPTVAATKYKPAPEIAYFSARGPSLTSANIIKPDIAAPGVNIVAAWMGNDLNETPEGKDPPLYNVLSGTSMSCPHVSGLAAVVKSHNPSFGPSHIKSAIMTTASDLNNDKSPITTHSGAVATAYDYGAGEMSPTAPLQPGLVYETTTVDYLNFLCYHGYNTTTIKLIANSIPADFACPKDSSLDLISNINYPSISVKMSGQQSKNVSRTLTNVAVDGESTYTFTTTMGGKGVSVQVYPTQLQFAKNGQKLTYYATFSTTGSSLKEDVFGAITWSSSKFKVRTPFVVAS
ncbi:CO(2)-response secreted protease [Linum perenne]